MEYIFLRIPSKTDILSHYNVGAQLILVSLLSCELTMTYLVVDLGPLQYDLFSANNGIMHMLEEFHHN